VASLRDDAVIGAVTRVWPMETGFTLTPTTDARVVLAEVWPGLATLDLSRHPVRDACQVLALVEEWRAADERGVLDERFAPQDVDDQARRAALTEEGWILGA
jgi:hypothetical protein